jgi:hypothetical protein
MNNLLGAARPVPCGGCGRRIQWHRALHTRILLGGLMFRAGAVAVVLSGLGAVLVPRIGVPYGLVAVGAAFLAVAGILVTRTPAARQFVELASSDA